MKAKNLKSAEFVMPAGGWIHIDVADGKFTQNITWENPADLENAGFNFGNLKPVHFEIHLMVIHPEEVIEEWLKAGAQRAIVHVEAMKDVDAILKTCEVHGADAMLAHNPETPAESLLPHLEKFTYVQVLAVKPGLAGQKFKPEVINKIKFLRERVPGVKIEVDGGITAATGRLCRDAGADMLVSASYLWNSKNPKKTFEELMRI